MRRSARLTLRGGMPQCSSLERKVTGFGGGPYYFVGKHTEQLFEHILDGRREEQKVGTPRARLSGSSFPPLVTSCEQETRTGRGDVDNTLLSKERVHSEFPRRKIPSRRVPSFHNTCKYIVVIT